MSRAIRSAASRPTTVLTWVHRSAVVVVELCPSRALTAFIETPAASARLALV
jgi:hypothetical protein